MVHHRSARGLRDVSTLAALGVAALAATPVARAEILVVDAPGAGKAYNLGRQVTAGGVQLWATKFNPPAQAVVGKHHFLEGWTRDVDLCYEEYSDYFCWRAGKNYDSARGFKLLGTVEGVDSHDKYEDEIDGPVFDPGRTYRYKITWAGNKVTWILDGKVVGSREFPKPHRIQLINVGTAVRYQGFPHLPGPEYTRVVVWEGAEPPDLETAAGALWPAGVNPHRPAPLTPNPTSEIKCAPGGKPAPPGGIPDPPKSAGTTSPPATSDASAGGAVDAFRDTGTSPRLDAGIADRPSISPDTLAGIPVPDAPMPSPVTPAPPTPSPPVVPFTPADAGAAPAPTAPTASGTPGASPAPTASRSSGGCTVVPGTPGRRAPGAGALWGLAALAALAGITRARRGSAPAGDRRSRRRHPGGPAFAWRGPWSPGDPVRPAA